MEKVTDLNVKDNNGSTPLLYAITGNSIYLVELKCIFEQFIFLFFILGKNNKIVKVLLKNGADPNIKTNNGKNAIRTAIDAGTLIYLSNSYAF